MKQIATFFCIILVQLLPITTTPLSATNPDPNPDNEAAGLNIEVLTLLDVSCFGLADGAVTVLASGGLPPYTYVWSNGMVGPVLLGLEAGVYTVTATDLLGATGELTVTIEEPLELGINVISQVNIDCGNPEGSITVGTSGGTGLALYLWSNGATSPTISNLDPGIYIVTATDENLCIDIETIEVTADLTLPAVSASVSAQITCLQPEVILDGTGSAVGADFLYLWTTVDGHIVSGANTLHPTVDEPGTYTLTVTDLLNSCTASESVVVEADIVLPSVNIVTGGGVDLQLDCATPEITLDGTGSAVGGNILYLWTTVNGHIVSGANTLHPIVDAAGEYTLTVTNAVNGCDSSATVEVTADLDLPLVDIDLTGDLQIDCLSPEITLDATGSATGAGIVYLWTTVDGHIAAGANTLTPTVDAAGTYALTITNTLTNCTATAAVTVTADLDLPIINIGAGIDLVIDCLTPEVTIEADVTGAGPGSTFLWTTLDGNIVAGANSLAATVDAAGEYTLTVIDGDNGCSASLSVDVTLDLGLPVIDIQIPGLLGCNNSAVTIDASASSSGAGFIYLWTTLNGHIVSGANTLTPTVDAAGEYTLTITGANGCTASAAITVSGSPAVSVEVANLVNVACFGDLTGAITVEATAGAAPFVYLWSNGETSASITGLAAGTYTVTVTDDNDCEAVVQVVVEQADELELSTSSTPVSQPGASDGTASATASGGTGAYTYLWSNGMTTANISGLAEGNYSVTVTDANGCTAEASTTVGGPGTCDLQVAVTGEDSDCGISNGSAYASVSGATGNVQFEWSNGMTTDTINGLSDGTYTVTVTDDEGCTATGSTTIEVLDDLDPTALAHDTIVYLNQNGTASITAAMIDNGSSDACGDVEIAIDITSFNCDDLGNNTVTLTVTDEAGNTATTTATVTVVDSLPPTSTCPDDMEIADCNGIAVYNLPTLDDNCGAVSIANTILVEGFASGSMFPFGTTTVTYAVIATTGDISTCSFEVNVTGALEIGEDITQPSCPGMADGMATAMVMGGSGNYTYLWLNANGQTTPTATGLAAGGYTVIVADDQGCGGMFSFTLTDPEPISVTLVVVGDDCGDGLGSIDISVGGGTGGYTFVWYDENGNVVATTEDLTDVPAGEYTVEITDANGCVYTFGAIVVDLFEDVAELVSPGTGVDIFPNPSSTGSVTLRIDLPREMEVSAELYDLAGQHLGTVLPLQLQASSFDANIDLGAYAGGSYLLKVFADGIPTTKKLIYMK
jgi:predicted RNase H-like HicB family nuclease